MWQKECNPITIKSYEHEVLKYFTEPSRVIFYKITKSFKKKTLILQEIIKILIVLKHSKQFFFLQILNASQHIN